MEFLASLIIFEKSEILIRRVVVFDFYSCFFKWKLIFFIENQNLFMKSNDFSLKNQNGFKSEIMISQWKNQFLIETVCLFFQWKHWFWKAWVSLKDHYFSLKTQKGFQWEIMSLQRKIIIFNEQIYLFHEKTDFFIER